MSVIDATLRAEYGAAVERMAGRALDALRGVEGFCVSTQVLSRAELAAVRVLGPDAFAAQAFRTPASADDVAHMVAEAYRVFPPARGGDAVAAWLDWATWTLTYRFADPVRTPDAAPAEAIPPLPEVLPPAQGWRGWSLVMARLAPLALPGLDGPVHDAVRTDPLPLARGTVRAMLRRDHRTAGRLVRWLAWLAHPAGQAGARAPACQGAAPLEVEPVIMRLKQVGDGSARAAFDLAVAEHLLETDHR